jgi:hypothetical protein
MRMERWPRAWEIGLERMDAQRSSSKGVRVLEE